MIMTFILPENQPTLKKRTMILPTGKKAGPQSAFTLIEVLLCVAIFAAGLTAIYQTMAVSWTALHYARMYAEADRLIEEKAWSLQSAARENQQKPPASEEGTFLGTNQTYAYHLRATPSGSEFLYQVRLSVSRKTVNKDRAVTRDFYVLLPVPAKP